MREATGAVGILLTRTMELSSLMEVLCSELRYGGQPPRVAIVHLKRAECNGDKFYIYFSLLK